MVLSTTHHRTVFGFGKAPAITPHHVLETVERGTYTAILSTVGFVIVSLLRVAERRERDIRHSATHLERP